MNIWLIIAVFFSIIWISIISNDNGISRSGLIPLFQYVIYIISIFSSILASLIAIVQAILAVPFLSEKIPKVLSAIVSSICSIAMIVISTIFFMGLISEIVVTQILEVYSGTLIPGTSQFKALVADHVFLIIAYIITSLFHGILALQTILSTSFTFFEIVQESNVVPSQKVLKPYNNNEFVAPSSQEYNLEAV